MAHRRERTVGVHPLAQVGQDLFAGLLREKGFKLRPFLALSPTDKRQNCIREDRTVAVEVLTRHRHIAAT